MMGFTLPRRFSAIVTMDEQTMGPHPAAPLRWGAVGWLTVALIWGCGGGSPVQPPDGGDGPVQIRGVSLSPQGFPASYAGTAAFLDEVAVWGRSAVLWNGAWRDDATGGSDAGQPPGGARLVAQEGGNRGVLPIPVFGWRSGALNHLAMPADPTNDWTNTAAREAFRAMLVDYATTYQPAYVFLGNENDFYFETNPADYAHWITAYNEFYDAIKAVSPETRVGPVFSFEHLSGRGVLAGQTTPLWGALEAHDLSRVDVIGLTLYPFLAYADPAAVPADYLAPLLSRIGDRPVVITETGWPAEDPTGLHPPWQVSPAAQLAYIPRLATLIAGHSFPVVNWLFLYAMADPGPDATAYGTFGSVSLRDAAGNQRPAYDAWVSFGG